jgi:signal transduction histidine kinase
MAWIRLIQDRNELFLEVADNGRGITRAQIENSGSFGIIGIRERVNLLKGTVRITSKSGRGTTVAVSIPLPEGET